MQSRRPHRQRLPALIALCVLALSGCSAEEPEGSGDGSQAPPHASTSAVPESGAVQAPFFGMHDGRVGSGVTPDAPVGALRLWDSATSWLHIETSPGQFVWDPLDTAVATAEAAAARPLLVLGQTPVFHASRPGEAAAYGPGAASMPDIEAWRRYVTAVAERYGDRIDYQIWNEANVAQFWAGTPRQMAELTLVASRAIRQVAPEATIVAPSFVLRLAGQRRYYEEYWSLQSREVDLSGAVDVVAVHLYPLAEEPPEAQVGLLESARTVLTDLGIRLPVWNTEINFGLQGGPEPPPIPAERQRAYLMRTYLLNAGLDVERVYWYRWDIGRIANTYLTAEDLATETLAGRSFDTVRQWLDGAVVEGCDVSDALWQCSARRGGSDVSFWWKPGGDMTRVSTDEATSWTDAEGEVTPCRDGCTIPVGETPVMVVLRG